MSAARQEDEGWRVPVQRFDGCYGEFHSAGLEMKRGYGRRRLSSIQLVNGFISVTCTFLRHHVFVILCYRRYGNLLFIFILFSAFTHLRFTLWFSVRSKMTVTASLMSLLFISLFLL